jgi:hypothetical protein
MFIVHLVLVLLYGGGMLLLWPLVCRRLPTPSAKFVPLYFRPWIAFAWLWNPVAWFLPGVLWMRVFDGFSISRLFFLSVLLPVSWFLIFLHVHGIPDYSSNSALTTRLVSAILVGSTLLVTTLVALTSVGEGQLTWSQLGMYVMTCLWGPALQTILLHTWSVKVVPLPHYIPNASAQAVQMVLGYLTSYPKPVWFVEDGELRTRIVGSPFLGSGPGCVVTEPENLVLLKTASNVLRIAGPGVTLTQAMVTPAQVVDLRNQFRSTVVNAVTRDGIEVSVPVSSLFRVDRGQKEIALGKPWPYRHGRSVFHAVFGAEVDPAGRSSHDFHAANPWEDRPLALASHKARQAISFYSLDQLYSSPSTDVMDIHKSLERVFSLPPVQTPPDPLVRSTLGKLVQRAVRQIFEAEGLEILGGSIGNRILPLQRDVINQRVAKWKMAFESKVTDWQIALKEKRLRAVNARQKARGLLVEEVVTQTSDRLVNMTVATQENIRAYEVLLTLVTVAQNPEVRKMLPDSAVPTLEKLMRQASGEEVDGMTV